MRFNPPPALDMDGWNEFQNEFRKKAPIRYFIEYFIVRKIGYISSDLSRIGWAIRYRTIRKYHLVNTKLNPHYHETDTRMLHANFELLVDFVEIQCANMATVFDDDARKKALGWKFYLPRMLRIKEFRSREQGMKHLEWEATLASPTLNENEASPGQAAQAVQIMILYIWWKDVYPYRETLPSPNEDSIGLDFLSQKWKKANPEMNEKISQWSRDSFQQESDWDKEEEEMLIALMKIRKGLWT